MQVKIFRVEKDLPLPQYKTSGSAGFDLCTREEVEILPGEMARIPSNLIVQMPENWTLLILPRSSTFAKFGLTFPHSIGLIDSDFCGEKDEILIQVLNAGATPARVPRGTAIAQGLFLQTEKAQFVETQTVNADSRGGFGSTDEKQK